MQDADVFVSANRPTTFLDPTGAAACTKAELGNVEKSRTLGVVLAWSGLRVPPNVPQHGVQAANAIADAIGLFKKIPKSMRPPLGAAPGNDEAAKLTGLTNLEVLDLSETSITDQALSQLSSFPHLRVIAVDNEPYCMFISRAA